MILAQPAHFIRVIVSLCGMDDQEIALLTNPNGFIDYGIKLVSHQNLTTLRGRLLCFIRLLSNHNVIRFSFVKFLICSISDCFKQASRSYILDSTVFSNVAYIKRLEICLCVLSSMLPTLILNNEDLLLVGINELLLEVYVE